MSSQIESLTPDEQEWLRQRRARASPATLTTRPPLAIDPILHEMPPQDLSTPSTSSLDLSLALPPSNELHPSVLPFGTQIPLGRPTFSIAHSPSVPGTLPVERMAQRRTIKRHRSLLESGTEGSGAENTYVGAAIEGPVDQVGLLLDNLTRRHEAFASPQYSDVIGSEAGAMVKELTHLFAERDAFASELLGVIKVMALQMKEWQARDGEGDVQAISRVRPGISSRKKLKVERTPFEQQVYDLVKVRKLVLTINPSYLT